MPRRSVVEAIAGAFDGMNTGLGLVVGLLAGVTVSGLLKVAIPAIVAGMASMAVSELVKDNENGWREVAAMGITWLIAAIFPILLSLIFTGMTLWISVSVGTLMIGALMNRGREDSWCGGLLKTYGCIMGVAVPTVLVAVLI